MQLWAKFRSKYSSCAFVILAVLLFSVQESGFDGTASVLEITKSDSQQLRNPAWVGLRCGMTVGVWCPHTFPSDVVRVEDNARRFFSPANLNYVIANARDSYLIWKRIGNLILALSSLAVIVAFRNWRKVRHVD